MLSRMMFFTKVALSCFSSYKVLMLLMATDASEHPNAPVRPRPVQRPHIQSVSNGLPPSGTYIRQSGSYPPHTQARSPHPPAFRQCAADRCMRLRHRWHRTMPMVRVHRIFHLENNRLKQSGGHFRHLFLSSLFKQSDIPCRLPVVTTRPNRTYYTRSTEDPVSFIEL